MAADSESESQAALLTGRLGRSGGPNDQAERDIRVSSPLEIRVLLLVRLGLRESTAGDRLGLQQTRTGRTH